MRDETVSECATLSRRKPVQPRVRAFASAARLLIATTAAATELGVTPRLIGAHEGAGVPHLYVLADYAQADGLTTPGDRVLMSLDRGERFTLLFQAAGDLLGWSLSQDGERLAVGGHADGIQSLTNASSASAGAALTQVSTVAAHALAWGSDGQLYAGGDEAENGFSVGVSSDGGHSFSALFALCQVKGPLSCPEDTTVGALCLSSGETGWDVRKEGAASAACTGTGGGSPNDGGTSSLPAAPAPLGPDAGGSSGATNGATSSAQTSSCAVSPSPDRGAGGLLLAMVVASGALLRRRRAARSWATSPPPQPTPVR